MSLYYGAPPPTLCDPNCLRDLDPRWDCSVPGCDCGSTPSKLLTEEFRRELADELRLCYELAELEEEAAALRSEARRLRDPWWLRAARWLRDAMID